MDDGKEGSVLEVYYQPNWPTTLDW